MLTYFYFLFFVNAYRMVKKVHSNSVQLHAKELIQDKENQA